jgi:aminoglycoside phosphotransferase (APT) family kinase protein
VPPELEEDIAAALELLGVGATHATRITGLPSRASDRATFRITLADGRVVKARRLRRPEKARRFGRLLRALAHPRLPAMLVLEGRVTIEEWVAGACLSELPPDPERLLQAADLLGSLHATRMLRTRRLHVRSRTGAIVRRAERQLAKLASESAITRPEARALLRALHRFAPAEAVLGLTHNDFCAENLVEDPDGRLIAVDNEGLRTGFLDFDLARTWYRWPMPEADWRLFLGRYATWRDPAPGVARAPFWRIAAVVKSAHLRISRHTARTETPIRRLRELLADLDRPAPSGDSD